MARIAIAAGFAVAGALTGGLAWAGFLSFGIGGSAIGAILGGAAVGFSVGQAVGSIFLPPSSSFSGPRMLDGQVSSSAPGSPLPFGYGSFRIGCQIIFATEIHETETTTSQSSKGAPTQTSTTYSYTVSFAAAACEGPASFTRIWGDSKLVYDATTKGSVTSNSLATGIGTNTELVVPAIYPGNSTQQPDPTIQAVYGVSGTPAFRGTAYFTYTDFPLADFGNRLPNFRAEVTTAITDAFLYDLYPPNHTVDPRASIPAIEPPRYIYVDQLNRVAFIVTADGGVIQRIDLNIANNVPLNTWQANNVYQIGDQIVDSNGDVEVVVAVSGDQESGSSVPTWTNLGWGSATTDHHVSWQAVGSGSEAIVVENEAVVTVPGKTFLGAGALPGAMCVDTLGYLWQSLDYNPANVNTGSSWRAGKLDPHTFVMIDSIDVMGAIGSFSAIKTPQRDIVGFTTQNNFTGGGEFFAVDAKNMSILARVSYLTGSTLGFASGVQPIAFSNDGTAYILSGYTDAAGAHGEFEIMVVDSRGGVGAGGVFHLFNGDATAGNGRSLLYNQVDDTLLVFTSNGYIIKIDAAHMTVLATSSAALFEPSSPQVTDTPYYYPAGQVPVDGVLRMMKENISSVFNIANVDVASLSLVGGALVPFTNWGIPSSSIHQPTGQSYDTVTNSLIVVGMAPPFVYRLYLDRRATGGETLDGVVRDLLERAGMDSGDIDVSALSSTVVSGYFIARNSDVKGALAPLTQAYFFDLFESDNTIKAAYRGGSAALSIPETDLGLLADMSEATPNFAQENDLPKTVEVLYYDTTQDYQQGQQTRQRNSRVIKTLNKVSVQLPLTLEPDAARQIADKALQTLWDERNSFQFNLWRCSYMLLDPSDVVQFTYNGNPYSVRLTKITAGQDLSLQVEAVSEDARNYSSALAGAPALGFIPTTINPLSPTILFLLDLPLLQDVDASPQGSSGYYYAMSAVGLGWPGGVLYSAPDGSTWGQVGFSNSQTPFGSVALPLAGTPSPWTWDNVNTITVYMSQGTLSSSTDLGVLNGANAYIIGNEVIQAVNADVQPDGKSYVLSRLLRGRRGTEWAIGSHTSSETFISLENGLRRNVAPLSQVGQTVTYKGVTVSAPTTSAIGQNLKLAGNDLKPYSVCQIVGTRNSNNDLFVNWVRRTRIGGALQDGTGTVPLAEDVEKYDVEFLQTLAGTPGVTLSPSTVLFPKVVDTGSMLINTEQVLPFTATFADGHQATYPGFDFALLGERAFADDYYVTVYDPTQQGGAGLNYFIDASGTGGLARANTAGYVYLGKITQTTDFNTYFVFDGGSDVVVVSELGGGAPSAYLSKASQQNFYGGSAQSKVRVRIYQLSAQVGRGFMAEAIV